MHPARCLLQVVTKLNFSPALLACRAIKSPTKRETDRDSERTSHSNKSSNGISCLKDVYWISTMRVNATLRSDREYITENAIFRSDRKEREGGEISQREPSLFRIKERSSISECRLGRRRGERNRFMKSSFLKVVLR